MRVVPHCLEMVMSGLTVTGASGMAGMFGFQVSGRDRHTQVLIGVILTMITINKAGVCMRDTGTERTMAIIMMTAIDAMNIAMTTTTIGTKLVG
jgi:hypothetical protein